MINPDRNIKIDILKCIASFSVVLGHSIQYSGVSEVSRLFDGLFLMIYSFHMPLFAIISGYLLYQSVRNKGVLHTIKRRLIIVFPLIIYSIPTFISYHIFSLSDSIFKNLMHFIGYVFIGNGVIWFLPTILICSILLSLVSCSKYSSEFIILIIILSLFAVKDYGMALLSFIFCFSAIGYFIARVQDNIMIHKEAYIICIVLYLILLYFWRRDYLIYNGLWSVIDNPNPFRQVCIDLYRIIIGVFGSVVVYYIVSRISFLFQDKREVTLLVGSNTLGIYCISNLVFEYITPLICITNEFVVFAIILFVATFISITAVILFNKSEHLKFLLLGHN